MAFILRFDMDGKGRQGAFSTLYTSRLHSVAFSVSMALTNHG
jgi:hypothetical protein